MIWRMGTFSRKVPVVVPRLRAVLRVELHRDRKYRPYWSEQATARSGLRIDIRTKCIGEFFLDLSGAPAFSWDIRENCLLLRALHEWSIMCFRRRYTQGVECASANADPTKMSEGDEICDVWTIDKYDLNMRRFIRGRKKERSHYFSTALSVAIMSIAKHRNSGKRMNMIRTDREVNLNGQIEIEWIGRVVNRLLSRWESRKRSKLWKHRIRGRKRRRREWEGDNQRL
jgi:hypothetical protein